MTGWLTTHVLDTARGHPAVGLQIRLSRLQGEGRMQLSTARTNADGRTDAPMLSGDAFALGVYELEFEVGDWFEESGLGTAMFLDVIPIRFRITENAHHHVPLLLAPFGYSTYRGS